MVTKEKQDIFSSSSRKICQHNHRSSNKIYCLMVRLHVVLVLVVPSEFVRYIFVFVTYSSKKSYTLRNCLVHYCTSTYKYKQVEYCTCAVQSTCANSQSHHHKGQPHIDEEPTPENAVVFNHHEYLKSRISMKHPSLSNGKRPSCRA